MPGGVIRSGHGSIGAVVNFGGKHDGGAFDCRGDGVAGDVAINAVGNE